MHRFATIRLQTLSIRLQSCEMLLKRKVIGILSINIDPKLFFVCKFKWQFARISDVGKITRCIRKRNEQSGSLRRFFSGLGRRRRRPFGVAGVQLGAFASQWRLPPAIHALQKTSGPDDGQRSQAAPDDPCHFRFVHRLLHAHHHRQAPQQGS